MAKEKKEEYKYEVNKIFGTLNSKDFTKAVLSISWFDNPPTVDIRSCKLSGETPEIRKGISLTNEEADALVSVLLDSGYGSLEDLEIALRKKKQLFSVMQDDIDREFSDDEDEPMVIDCG